MNDKDGENRAAAAAAAVARRKWREAQETARTPDNVSYWNWKHFEIDGPPKNGALCFFCCPQVPEWIWDGRYFDLKVSPPKLKRITTERAAEGLKPADAYISRFMMGRESIMIFKYEEGWPNYWIPYFQTPYQL